MKILHKLNESVNEQYMREVAVELIEEAETYLVKIEDLVSDSLCIQSKLPELKNAIQNRNKELTDVVVRDIAFYQDSILEAASRLKSFNDSLDEVLKTLKNIQ